MTMDTRILLVKCITLLYRESLIKDKTENSVDLARSVMENIKLPELSLSVNSEKEMLMALKATLLHMCNSPLNTVYEKDELLQRLKINCASDEQLFQALQRGIEKDMDDDSLKRTVISIRKYITDSFKENEVVTIFTKAANALRFEREKIPDLKHYLQEFIGKIEPYQIEGNKDDPAIVESVDVHNLNEIAKIYDDIKKDEDRTSILVTGWQGLNDALQGGFRRGEQWVIPALQHSYKTGFTLSLFKHFAIYNTPQLTDPNKKPLLLRISFEDNLISNFRFLYENLYENEHGTTPDISALTSTEIATYVRDKLQVNGYHVKFIRVNPSEWTLRDLQNTVLELEAAGYELHVCMLDYLPMLPTTGCEEGPAGHALRDLYRRTRNFFSAKKITLITPHQLSTEAKMLIRDGHTEFVKMVVGKGYYDGCKRVDQEVDGELYLHIEKINGRAYLTVQRGKHRGVGIIPDSMKYLVLPFPEASSIPDDLDKKPIHTRKVGGGVEGSGEETPFWSYT